MKQKLSPNDIKLRRKLNILLIAIMSVLYIIFRFALEPLFYTLDADVAYGGTILPTLIESLCQIADIVAMSAGYAVTAYSMYRYGTKETYPTYIIFTAITLLQLFAGYIMGLADNRPELELLMNLLVAVILLSLQYFVLILIYRSTLSRHKHYTSERAKNAKILGEELPGEDFGIYPFKGVFDHHNPMIKIAFWSAVVVIVTSVLNVLPSLVWLLIDVLNPSFWIFFGEKILMSVVKSAICYFSVIYLLVLFFEVKFKRELYKD